MLRATMLAVCGALLALSGQIAAAATAQGTIAEIWIYGNGDAVVTGLSFSGTSCTNSSGFILPASNSNFSKLMALLLSAKTSGATVSVSAAKVTNCWYPEITADGNSFIVLL